MIEIKRQQQRDKRYLQLLNSLHCEASLIEVAEIYYVESTSFILRQYVDGFIFESFMNE